MKIFFLHKGLIEHFFMTGVLLSGYERFGDEKSLEENALAHLSEVIIYKQ